VEWTFGARLKEFESASFRGDAEANGLGDPRLMHVNLHVAQWLVAQAEHSGGASRDGLAS
jgi:hypothetical protein